MIRCMWKCYRHFSCHLEARGLQGCPTCGPGWLWMRPDTKSWIYLKHYEIFFFCLITCLSVFNVWPETTLFLAVWPRDPKSWTPLLENVSSPYREPVIGSWSLGGALGFRGKISQWWSLKAWGLYEELFKKTLPFINIHLECSLF